MSLFIGSDCRLGHAWLLCGTAVQYYTWYNIVVAQQGRDTGVTLVQHWLAEILTLGTRWSVLVTLVTLQEGQYQFKLVNNMFSSWLGVSIEALIRLSNSSSHNIASSQQDRQNLDLGVHSHFKPKP